ncbi:hypothetical protein ACIBFB_10205 [Nocardiopsis sp. NPDC050513]|uniref:hypothetical protein n=1 Tax=Nocardiopsis sp. NPDC050513 TaxID=3364338 RepID=UPI0037BD4680
MRPLRNRHDVLQGSPPEAGHGVRALLTARAAADTGEPQHTAPAPAQVLLAVPLLRVVGPPGRRRVVVGQARVTAREHADDDAEETSEDGVDPQVTLVLNAVWHEARGWHADHDVAPEVDDELVAALARPAHRIGGDARSVAVDMGKALAEGSRNAVAQLRALRYDLERRIADELAARSDQPLRPLLAAVLELATAMGQARDQASAALRDGLWIWLWDDTVYDHNGQHSDTRVDADTLPDWASTHRLGLRHCEAMARELEEEVSRLHALLGSMSTFAVAQSTDAQNRFTLLVGVGAAVIGLPALILALYGADAYLPLDSFDRAWRALLPVGATALAAAAAAIRWMPGTARPHHYAVAAVAVAAVLVMLLVAGALTPG